MTTPDTAERLKSCLTDLFNAANQKIGPKLVRALVAINTTYTPGKPIVTPYFDLEMNELFDFVRGLKNLVHAIEDGHWPYPTDVEMSVRLRTLAYCHMLEADLPYFIILNLYRMLDSRIPSWVFYDRNADDSIKFDRKGKKHIRLKRISEKIAHLRKYSYATRISVPEHLESLWNSDLRNAFSHSRYAIRRDGTLELTPWKSGAVDESQTSECRHKIEFRQSEIVRLSGDVWDYLAHLAQLYNQYIKPFRQAEQVELEQGIVHWDFKRKRWMPGKRNCQGVAEGKRRCFDKRK